MDESKIALTTAKLAKERGFDEMVEGYWVEYLVDNIDPDYPEGGGAFSMTKGETEVIDFWAKNSSFKNEDSYACYSCPTLYMLQKWLRDEHDMHVTPYMCNLTEVNKDVWRCCVDKIRFSGHPKHHTVQYSLTVDGKQGSKLILFDTYEEALGEGLRYALKMIKI